MAGATKRPDGSYEMKSGGNGKKSPKVEVEDINIRKADNGGFIVRCHKRYAEKQRPADNPMPYLEPSEAVFATWDEVDAYARKELGVGASS
jgi:hypothetical protein